MKVRVENTTTATLGTRLRDEQGALVEFKPGINVVSEEVARGIEGDRNTAAYAREGWLRFAGYGESETEAASFMPAAPVEASAAPAKASDEGTPAPVASTPAAPAETALERTRDAAKKSGR